MTDLMAPTMLRDISRILEEHFPNASISNTTSAAGRIIAYLNENVDREPTFIERADHFSSLLHIGLDSLSTYFSDSPQGGDTSLGWRIAEFDRDLLEALVSSSERLLSQRDGTEEEIAVAAAFVELEPHIAFENQRGIGWHLEALPERSLKGDIVAFRKALMAWRWAITNPD